MGPCAGGAVYSPALTDFIVMVQDSSYMFVTGPDVIKAVTHENVSKEELGGASTHMATSGVTHMVADNDKGAIAILKQLLSYLPLNNRELPPKRPTTDPLNRLTENLRNIIPDNPNQPYDMRKVISEIVDERQFFEIQAGYAKNLVIGFCNIGGHSVGIVANQPAHLAGALDINASDKGARFVRFCDAFNIPLAYP